MPDTIVHLSSIAGAPLLDSAGERLGRVEDVVARLDQAGRDPAVVGLVAGSAGARCSCRNRARGAARAGCRADGHDEAQPGPVRAPSRRGAVARRRPRPQPDQRSQRARWSPRARSSWSCEDGTWRVAGIDPSFRVAALPPAPAALPRPRLEHAEFVPWRDIEPFVGHVPTSRLKLGVAAAAPAAPGTDRRPRRGRLAQRGRGDPGGRRVRTRSSRPTCSRSSTTSTRSSSCASAPMSEVAAVLARMASDDAADLLLEIQQDRRVPVLNLLPAAKQRKIKRLLGYNPSTAGGLMNPDFVSVPASATVADALEHVRAQRRSRRSRSRPCAWSTSDGALDRCRLAGRAGPGAAGAAAVRADRRRNCRRSPPRPRSARGRAADDRLQPGRDAGLDQSGAPVGIIAVDDVLELTAPGGVAPPCRRRARVRPGRLAR